MPVILSLVPQLKQTAPRWARSLPPSIPSQTIERAVQRPIEKILSSFQAMTDDQKAAKASTAKPQIKFVKRKLFGALHLLPSSNFLPPDFKRLFDLGESMEEGKRKEWEGLVTDISERMTSEEIRNYDSFAKFILLCNILNDEWFSRQGLFLYKNQGVTFDALDEFDSLDPAQLEGELHYIVNGRPTTAYFLHSVNSETPASSVYNYSSVGYITCNLDYTSSAASFVLNGGIEPDETPDIVLLIRTPEGIIIQKIREPEDEVSLATKKVSRILKERYGDPENFLPHLGCDRVIFFLCEIGMISSVEKRIGSQFIVPTVDFYEDFIRFQLKDSKLKKIYEPFIASLEGDQNKERIVYTVNHALYEVAVKLQKGALSLDPKITLFNIANRIGSEESSASVILTPKLLVYLLADELHEKIQISEDPLEDPDILRKFNLRKVTEYIEKLSELSNEDLTQAFKNISRREFNPIMDEPGIVLVN